MRRKKMKKRLKVLREMALEQLEIEQKKQVELREQLNDESIDQDLTRKSLDESNKHIKMLKDSLEDYNKLIEVKWKVSLDTLLMIAGNLAGILLVLNFEKLDIVRSKAFGMVMKTKL